MKTRGPRFSGGYQFPRTNAARLKRGEPIREERLGNGAVLRIVPLTGGLRKQFDVCGQWTKRAPDGPIFVTDSTIVRDELEARLEYARLVQRAGA